MPKSKQAASTSSTTKGKGSASAVSPDDKLKQQCLDLKKNIYDRWEQSIMSRNNFSPAVHRGAGSAGSVAADAVGGPSAGTTPAAATTAAAAQAVARPQVKFIAATLSDGAPVRASPSSGNVNFVKSCTRIALRVSKRSSSKFGSNWIIGLDSVTTLGVLVFRFTTQ